MKRERPKWVRHAREHRLEYGEPSYKEIGHVFCNDPLGERFQSEALDRHGCWHEKTLGTLAKAKSWVSKTARGS